MILWSASVVAAECVQEHAQSEAELLDCAELTHEQIVEVYRRAERDRLTVAMVHAGDPSLWGGLQSHVDACRRMDADVEIVPGVAEFSAAAATAGRELATEKAAQSVVVAKLDGVPTGQTTTHDVLREFARQGTTLSVLVSAARTAQLVQDLRAGGCADDVPVLVAYRITLPDELVFRTTVGELENAVKQHKLWRQVLFVIGRELHDETQPRAHARASYRRSGAARRFGRGEAEVAPARAGGSDSAPAEAGETARNIAEPTGPAEAAPSWAKASEVSFGPVVPQARLPLNRDGRPNPDVAWHAVRNWQETAREAARTSTSRRAVKPGATQAVLFVDVAERSATATAEAPPVAENAEPQPTKAPVERPQPAAPPKDSAATEPEAANAVAPQQESDPASAQRSAPKPKQTAPARRSTTSSTAKVAPKSRAKSTKTGKRTTKRKPSG